MMKNQTGIAAIIIIAGVIILLAILATILKFALGGATKSTSQASPKPSTAIALITPSPIVDTEDLCSPSDPECSGGSESEFSAEGDGVTAQDLDGEG